MKERKISLLPVGIAAASILSGISAVIYAICKKNNLSVILFIVAIAIVVESVLIHIFVDKKSKKDAYSYLD